MRPFDWLVVVVYITYIVIDGLRRSKGTDKVAGYFLANRSLPWWAVGLTVMATQLSAVTMIGTTGLDGMFLCPCFWQKKSMNCWRISLDDGMTISRVGAEPKRSRTDKDTNSTGKFKGLPVSG